MKSLYLNLKDNSTDQDLSFNIARVAIELSRLPDGTISKDHLNDNLSFAFKLLTDIETKLLNLQT